MPFYHEKLLSNWGYERKFEASKQSPAIDPDVLKQLQPDPNNTGRAQWVRNPRKAPRNHVDTSTSREINGSLAAVSRPISEKTSNGEPRVNAAADAFAQIALPSGIESVPQMYQCIPITYGDWKNSIFDFG